MTLVPPTVPVWPSTWIEPMAPMKIGFGSVTTVSTLFALAVWVFTTEETTMVPPVTVPLPAPPTSFAGIGAPLYAVTDSGIDTAVSVVDLTKKNAYVLDPKGSGLVVPKETLHAGVSAGVFVGVGVVGPGAVGG